MPRRRRTLLHGLLLLADSGIRVSLGRPFSVVNTLIIYLVFLVTALGGVQGGSCASPCDIEVMAPGENHFWKKRSHASG